ncbi:hypothetical protein [Streptomyces anulatus]|uniref:hypothetical protein n=1 Tax=Streptomyces anulatus TaxID=1892 RepID=UPI002151EF44|nr:hypothetical protein [Streptomyces anulatus]
MVITAASLVSRPVETTSYKTEQGRRWFRHNPNGADAIAAATKAADTTRERVAEYLLATRLKQLRDQTAARTGCPNSPGA